MKPEKNEKFPEKFEDSVYAKNVDPNNPHYFKMKKMCEGIYSRNDVLKEGDVVRLSGGYEGVAEWLGESLGDKYSGQSKIKSFIDGKVIGFIPGSNEKEDAIVKLSKNVKYKDKSGDIVVLNLRFVGAHWSRTNIVSVELCDFVPEAKQPLERKRGHCVEDHSTYEIIEQE